MRKYYFEVMIEEGNDEWWESLEKLSFDERCNEIRQGLIDCLGIYGFSENYGTEVRMIKVDNGDEPIE